MVTLQALEAALPKLLTTKDRDFAMSLWQQWDRKGELSDEQMYWAEQMVDRAINPQAAQREKIEVGSFAGVMALFAKAKQHLKFPKITLLVDGLPLQLSLAGERSKTPGQVNVTDGGPYGNSKWYGRVDANGTFEKSRNATPRVEAFLKEFSKSPAAVAKAHGQLTGRCCFCNAPLSDERSTAAGFGPVCARNYGLEAEWKASAGVLE